MIVGIMQPYFVPYIGYWQLMNAVDKYVIYDDVNFINGGWINRNRILVDGQIKYFNIPMLGASPNKLINEIVVNHNSKLRDKNLRRLWYAYKRAPYFDVVFPMMERILNCKQATLAMYIKESFQCICEYLDIGTELIMSSELNKDNQLKGQNRVLSICELLGATYYYNAIGGQDLYSIAVFQSKGIELRFLKTGVIQYQQFASCFVPDLSIIDVMMFNSKEEIKKMLDVFTLVGGI